jgi:hypothetical protein
LALSGHNSKEAVSLLFLFLGGIKVSSYSRIFQITEEPVAPEEFITEDSFCDHWFLASVAEYVSDDISRPDDCKWLRRQLENVAHFDTADTFTILPGGKETYFAKAYDEFIAARHKTMTLGLAEFSSGHDFSEPLSVMRDAYNEEFGFYAALGDSDEFEIVTMDEFIRDAEIGRRCYIGGIIDYHY